MSDGAAGSHLCGSVALGGIGARDGERDLHAMAGSVGELEAEVFAGTTGRRDIERDGHARTVEGRVRPV